MSHAHWIGLPVGKQVRDLLHPADLYSLIKRQLSQIDDHPGEVFNVGGGNRVSTSLLEMTALCEEVLGNHVVIESDPRTSPVDIPLYVSDCSKAAHCFDWAPRRSVRNIVEDIVVWIRENEEPLKRILT